MVKQSERLGVMQFVLNLDRAGAQEVVRTLAEHLQAKGCRVAVCAFKDGPIRAELESLGIKVEIVRRPRYSIVNLPMYLKEMGRIRRELSQLIETYQVDVAQTHILEALDFLILTLRNHSNLRLVLWTVQNAEFLPEYKHWLLGPKRFVYRLLYRLLVNRVDGFIAVSDEVRQSLLRQLGPIDKKIFTICNAVDLKQFKQRSSDEKARLCRELDLNLKTHLIATIGRLVEQKGHRYLIEAARNIVVTYPDTRFLFVGEGELKTPLQQQILEAGLTKYVHFLGVRSDVPEILVGVDLFVLPSLWEGLSVALLEAMAAGKPIVATAVSGTTQALINGQTGVVVPPYDSRALANAIMQLLSEPNQAQALGQAARHYVTLNFGAEKQAEEHLELYHRLIASLS